MTYRSPDIEHDLEQGVWLSAGIEHRRRAAFTEVLASGLVDTYPEVHEWGTRRVYVQEQGEHLALVAGALDLPGLTVDDLNELYIVLSCYLEGYFRHRLPTVEITEQEEGARAALQPAP